MSRPKHTRDALFEAAEALSSASLPEGSLSAAVALSEAVTAHERAIIEDFVSDVMDAIGDLELLAEQASASSVLFGLQLAVREIGKVEDARGVRE